MAQNLQTCQNTVMSNVTMWKARHGDKVVQVQGMALGLEKGSEYFNPHVHKGSLTCAYCDAAVKPAHDLIAVGGVGRKPPSPHFVTAVGDKHADCLWPFRERSAFERPVISPNKGYRIHLNTKSWSEEFNEASRYKRNALGQYMPLPASLRNMERLVVNSASDLTVFLRKGEFPRVNQSRIMFMDHDMAWDEFFFHHKKYDRLVERLAVLAAQRKSEQRFPAMMEFMIDEHYTSKEKKINSRRIVMNKPDDRGRPQTIQVTAFKNEFRSSFLADAFTHGKGTYFVLGQVRYKRSELQYSTTHYLNISLTDADQVVKDDIRAIRDHSRPPPTDLFGYHQS